MWYVLDGNEHLKFGSFHDALAIMEARARNSKGNQLLLMSDKEYSTYRSLEKPNEVKKVNMKQKVINATYRKDSSTFSEWMKYEIEIMNEDGSTEKIPAYGKDLQDALSRVVHDKRVVAVEKRTKRIPDLVWVVLWFGYVLASSRLLNVNVAK